MKMLVTGGNRGLGLFLATEFAADSVSRNTGIDITKDYDRLAQHSLNYDIFVNNAFDGPPQEPWANFGQTRVYLSVYDAWKKSGKSGWIFNVGSIGSKSVVSPEPRFETYRINKAALEYASKQGTQAFKHNHVQFKTTLISIDRLNTDLSRSRASWTGNGIDCADIGNFINYVTSVSANTVIDEAVFYVNFDHGSQ